MAAIVVLAGCTKGAPKLPTIAATGTLTRNGQPLADATVAFMPADADSGKPASGVTDALGKFVLKTSVGGSSFSDGAMAGEYKVTVVKNAVRSNPNGPAMAPEEFAKLSQEEKEKLKRGTSVAPKVDEIASKSGADAKDAATSAVPAPPESEIPKIYTDFKTTTLTAVVRQGEKNDFPFDLGD